MSKGRPKKKTINDLNNVNIDPYKLDEYNGNDLKRLAQHLLPVGYKHNDSLSNVKERLKHHYGIPKRGRPELIELEEGDEFEPEMTDKYKHTTVRDAAKKLGIPNYKSAKISELRTKIKDLLGSDVGNVNHNQIDLSISEFKLINQSPTSKYREYQYMNIEHINDYDLFITNLKNDLDELLEENIDEMRYIKILQSMTCHFKKPNRGKADTTFDKTFMLEPLLIHRDNIFSRGEPTGENFIEYINRFKNQIDQFTENGSGWIFVRVINFEIKIRKIVIRRGGTFVELPPCIANKKALINIQSYDNRCFEYSLLYLKHKDDIHKNPQCVSKYKKYIGEFKFDKCEFPIKQCDIPKIEKLNHIAIVVIELITTSDDQAETGGYEMQPYYTNKSVNGQSYETGKTADDRDVYFLALYKDHYMPIKKLSALFATNSNHRTVYPCLHCLNTFNNQENLDKHENLCTKDGVKSVFPKNDSIKFNQYNKIARHPFVIYADFESTLQPEPVNGHQSTQRLNHHKPNAIGSLIITDIKGLEDLNYKIDIVSGDDCIDHFLKYLQFLVNKLELHYQEHEDTCKVNWKSYYAKDVCDLCHEEFFDPTNDEGEKKGKKCAQFNLNNDKYNGAVHYKCSFACQYRNQPNITVLFHNGSKYDTHFLMQKIGKHFKNIGCIAKTCEKYSSITLEEKIKFIDSINFLPSSLDTLVKNTDKSHFNIFKKFNDREKDTGPTEEDGQDLLRKGVFPYEYITSSEVLDETKLPKRKKFYSQLNGKGISKSDYKHALYIFEKYNCQSIRDYLELYLKCDVILLADVFENYRKLCLKENGMDPVHFITAPSRSWASAMFMTNQEIDLVKDLNIHLLLEKHMYGGISQISHRYSKANNPYLKGYDPQQPHKYILYFDANNLYGYCMTLPLPVSAPVKVDVEITDVKEFINKIDEYGTEGYNFLVDLHIPEKLHDYYNDYPPAPEHIKVTKEEISKYNRELSMDGVTLTSKLLCTLKDKIEYYVDFRYLKSMINNGVEVMKVHEVHKFRMEPFLKEYIDYNNKKRAEAKSEAEKNYFKLANNAIFGKTIENVRKRKDFKLACTEEEHEKQVSSYRCKGFGKFNDDMYWTNMSKKTVKLDKPIQIGFSILNLSKKVMFDYYYDNLKPKYGDKIKLLATDTDSFIFEVETDDFYKDMYKDRQGYYDISDYPNEMKYGNGKKAFDVKDKDGNKKRLGYFKDEYFGKVIEEFVGLKSKMYSIKAEGDGEFDGKRTAKGIKEGVKCRELKHEDYKEVLFEKTDKYVEQCNIISKNHDLYTVKQNKKALSGYDDKRYVLINGIGTLAYGHYSLKIVSTRV